MIAVTSFSPKGYELYGKKFLDSAADYWPTKIIAYVEEEMTDTEQVTYKLLSEVNGHDAFGQYCETNPVFCGRVGTGYNYNYDAKKFSHKAFAQFDALTNRTGKVFWLDADIVFKKEVKAEFLTDLFDNHTICALQRPGFYTECGFLGFDTERDDFQPFLSEYINVYRKGLLFQLKGWHDCYAFDYAVEKSGVSVKNLTEKNAGVLNVLPYSVLGEYMVHNKGDRKNK